MYVVGEGEEGSGGMFLIVCLILFFDVVCYLCDNSFFASQYSIVLFVLTVSIFLGVAELGMVLTVGYPLFEHLEVFLGYLQNLA